MSRYSVVQHFVFFLTEKNPEESAKLSRNVNITSVQCRVTNTIENGHDGYVEDI